MRDLSTILIWLLVINLGIVVGAGLYEHRIALSRWLSSSTGEGTHWNAQAARQDDVGRKFWVFVTTIPLTLLTCASLVVAWSASGPIRRWWSAIGFLLLADRVITFSYFIPTMIGLLGATDSTESVAKATQWRALNYLRLAIALAAWLAALKTFLLLNGRR